MPTLVQALQFTAEQDWLVNVEIKSFPERQPGLVEAVLEAIASTGTADRVLLSSFDHTDMARIPELVPEAKPELRGIPRGILVETPIHQPGRYLTEIVGAHAYHTSAASLGAESIAYRRLPSSLALRTDHIRELQSRQIPILVFTVNDTGPDGLADHLSELGIDALFTDDPGSLMERWQ